MTIKEKLERLEMCDQDSSGCSITLAEWLNHDNVEILKQFIVSQVKEVVEELVGEEIEIDDLLLPIQVETFYFKTKGATK